MSAYSENVTQFKDAKLLCEALAELGYTEVEVHEQATNLYGYHGDKRADLANIIIRRKFIGYASNDIGFKRNQDGTYGAIISEFDSDQHNADWMRRLKVAYAEKGLMQQARKQGLRFAGKSTVNGKTRLQFVQA